jgi:hypothetical protein
LDSAPEETARLIAWGQTTVTSAAKRYTPEKKMPRRCDEQPGAWRQEMGDAMSIDRKMPWGKHAGESLTDIESSYLCWVLEESNARADLRADVEHELARRFAKAAPPPPASSWRRPCPDPVLAANIVSAGLHALARKHHPDVGGNTRTMQLLNEAAAWLKSAVPQ